MKRLSVQLASMCNCQAYKAKEKEREKKRKMRTRMRPKTSSDRGNYKFKLIFFWRRILPIEPLRERKEIKIMRVRWELSYNK